MVAAVINSGKDQATKPPGYKLKEVIGHQSSIGVDVRPTHPTRIQPPLVKPSIAIAT